MGGNLSKPPRPDKRVPDELVRTAVTLVAGLVFAAAAPRVALAIGESSFFEVYAVEYSGGDPHPRPTAPYRLGWEVRKRTSIEVPLQHGGARLDDPAIYEHPFLYWSGDEAFDELSDAEIAGLRRFVRFGGFVLIDDAAPEQSGFDRSVRRALSRAFPDRPLRELSGNHTIYRSFYLLSRPEGRIRGPDHLEAIEIGDRVAVLYSRHDLGGAWARDNLGSWQHPVTPGGDEQRERAIRLGVNVVMYALCLDYKDDQVHAPFIMRRRGGSP
ncbi:MAG TPA: DUF4159 domain-containing protein [Sandaracinaceae bacterium LLY-WYZ-13_1]|nr:DUF4159 domain-containing protein [Sandaracinaceae bacterium LLY-WYZ-13_1]